MPISDREILVAWAAGFIDGEGCITIVRSNYGKNFRLSISAGQRWNSTPLKRLLKLFGGSIQDVSKNGSGATHYWRADSRIAAAAIEEMLPHLTVKRRQAQLALKFQERRQPMRNRWATDNEKHWQRDSRDFQKMKDLKRVTV